MTTPDRPQAVAPRAAPGLPRRVHLGVVAFLQLIMAVELALALLDRQWITAFLVLAIMAVILAPLALGSRLGVRVPAELQLLTVLFVFAALFLGEIQSYYERIWWWDMALHASSGLLLGILGFLLVYVLNESERVDLHLHPRFVALFAFVFALAVGTLWEIFEFGMDRLAGTRMQKAMLGDPSGLTDSMWDLIVDALGALTVSVFGWWYMKRGERTFIEDWIRKFIEHNPQLFRRRGGGRR